MSIFSKFFLIFINNGPKWMGKCPGINGFQTFGTLDHPTPLNCKNVGTCLQIFSDWIKPLIFQRVRNFFLIYQRKYPYLYPILYSGLYNTIAIQQISINHTKSGEGKDQSLKKKREKRLHWSELNEKEAIHLLLL